MKINHNYHNNLHTSYGENTCEFIVLHHTATSMEQLNGTINVLSGRTNTQVSCHYLIDWNGEIYQFADDKKIARHAGVSERVKDGKKYVGLNKYSIGIENIGPGFTDKQREANIELIKYLMNKHMISKYEIIRHKDIAPGRKVDIDDSFRSQDAKTFDERKDIYLKDDDKEELKKELIRQQMAINSKLRELSDSQKTKDMLHEMNTYWRQVGF